MTALEQYRIEIAKVPVCSDADFATRLHQYRAGDEEAGRAITGCFLGMALGLVETLPQLPEGFDALDAVQEANAGLVEALRTFTGSTNDEFSAHARQTIQAWLTTPDTQD